MLVRLLQFQKAYSLIEVTLSGIVILCRLMQLANKPEEIDLKPLGNVMLVRLSQPAKA
jgi:hypothetical protein